MGVFQPVKSQAYNFVLYCSKPVESVSFYFYLFLPVLNREQPHWGAHFILCIPGVMWCNSCAMKLKLGDGISRAGIGTSTSLQPFRASLPIPMSVLHLRNIPELWAVLWEKDDSHLPIDPQDLSDSSQWISIKLPHYSHVATRSILFPSELACQSSWLLAQARNWDFQLSKQGEDWGKMVKTNRGGIPDWGSAAFQKKER